MDRVEAEAEQLLGGEQVPEVGAGESAAGIAGTLLIGRARVARVAGGLDLQAAAAGEEKPVARHAGGQDAVEEIDPRHRAAEQIFRRAHAHEVARLRRRQELRGVLHAGPHRLRLLAHGKSAQRVPGEIELGDLARVAHAQVLVQPALHDAEERRRPRIAEPRLLAAARPARGARQRLLVVRARRLRRRALVERHQDVAAELQLDPRRRLGSELVPAPVEVAAEDRPLLGDLALLGQ